MKNRNYRNASPPFIGWIFCFVLLSAWQVLYAQSEEDTMLQQWEEDLQSGLPELALDASREMYLYWENNRDLGKAFAARHRYWQTLETVDSMRTDYINLALDLGRFCGNRLGLVDSSEYYINLSLDLLEKQAEDSITLGKAYTYKGYFYYKKGYYKMAMQWYLESLTIKEAIGYHAGVGYSYHMIGKLYEAQEMYEQSLEAFSRAIEEAKLSGERNQVLYLKSMGLVYGKMGEEEKALDYLYKALAVSKERESQTFLEPMVHQALGEVYFKFLKYEKAMIHQEKAFLQWEQKNNRTAEAGALVQIAQIYLRQKNYFAARQALQRAEPRAALEKSPSVLTPLYEVQNEVYAAIGDFEKAWNAQRNFAAIKDSLKSIEMKTQIFELEQLYSNEKNESRIQQLENQRIQNSEKLRLEKVRRQLLMAFAGFLVLVLSFIVYLFYQLKSKNTSLVKALEERKMLIREIHHRVKNNLQMISSLLFLQSRNLPAEAAGATKGILHTMRSRVKSMALVHQKLYHENEVGIVLAKSYIDDLLHSLLPSFGINDATEGVEVNVDDLRLDIDTMIPIGLILNELLTNAIKHASQDQTPPSLVITLQREGEGLVLKVKDNGQGIAPQSLGADNRSFGMSLINALAEKLDAEVSVKNEVGTEVSIQMKYLKIYER